MSKKATGGCLCGTVRFELRLPTKWCAHCHCTICRRAHGAGFVTWVGVDAEQFLITAGEDQLHRFRSSNEAIRSFCASCGSTMLFESQKWPGEVHVVLANIATPIDREPEGHAYLEAKASWIPEWEIGLPRKVH
ncbi:MAG: GFA family protein [Gammaproteobacteria bacterium]|nr:GFA family protein [Gammaproteobacteria bacterium]NNF61540.1 GFA family protein [Gammaproteobacteria bacterium]NNM19908.1 GFA family protein [Gammaproteobacteria bacterium]